MIYYLKFLNNKHKYNKKEWMNFKKQRSMIK